MTREEARERLRELLPPGTVVHTVLRHVSKSGMSRWIDVIAHTKDGPENISWLAAQATGLKVNTRNHSGVEMGGCGSDMGFMLVYELSSALYPDGFTCIGEELEGRGRYGRCPSNDHSNGDRDYTPHPHQDGGYALVQKWL